jgi:hypothetical protein
MKKLICSFLFFGSITVLYSQSLKKYDIGNSGCVVYSFCDPVKFDMNYSQDSAKVYTSECKNEDAYYGIICIKLAKDISAISEAEAVLVTYLDYLKGAFKITAAAGYGKGHRLKGKENTRGIIDFWKDDEQNNWKVKGWTDGKFMAVLYVYSKKELPETKLNVFLDGLVFKGM